MYSNHFKKALFFSNRHFSLVTIDIYNLRGVKILTIINNKLYPTGILQVVFYPRNLNSGIYICLLKINSTIKTSKLIISKK